MAGNLIEGTAIPDALLEGIAGGVLSDEVRDLLDRAVSLLKAKGTTKERTLEIFSLTDDPELRADSLAYIEEIWDTL